MQIEWPIAIITMNLKIWWTENEVYKGKMGQVFWSTKTFEWKLIKFIIIKKKKKKWNLDTEQVEIKTKINTPISISYEQKQ